MNEWPRAYSIVFVTFRRRFLSPQPFRSIKRIDKERIIKGPFPDVNKTAILRYFYCLPQEKEVSKSNYTSYQLLPLRLEVFCQGKSPKWAKDVTEKVMNSFEKTGSIWNYYPSEKTDFAFVPVPKIILKANKLNQETLNRVLETYKNREELSQIAVG
jgi:hypothetical protein